MVAGGPKTDIFEDFDPFEETDSKVPTKDSDSDSDFDFEFRLGAKGEKDEKDGAKPPAAFTVAFKASSVGVDIPRFVASPPSRGGVAESFDAGFRIPHEQAKTPLDDEKLLLGPFSPNRKRYNPTRY